MRAVFLVSILALGACSKAKPEADEAAQKAVATVTVDQLDHSIAKNECIPVDANGDMTRQRMGVIPGAVLLSDYDSFQLSELPADKAKPLVFYCADTECGASHQAAEKAITAGYTHVKVMPAGIAGWVQAGKRTQSI
jgi:rhodanese-related sulfurtransferase